MRKIIIKSILLLVILVISVHCERDDICIDATTPNLIIRFYDQSENTTLKSVDELKMEIDSLGTYIEYNTYSAIDSLVIPLRIDDDLTKLRFTINESTTPIIDNFTLNYERNFVFVSRSCGYKSEFLNIQTTNATNNWIQTLNIIKQNIQDENQAHLTMYH